MLARQYDNYAWEEEQQRQEPLPVRRKREEADPYGRLRSRVMIFMAVILATYFLAVIRSEAMVQYGNQLVSMHREERLFTNKNNELRIEVEQLKGPERIIGLAEQRLGMSVARSNIYVKAAAGKNNPASLAAAAK